jgi:hypothetical protein
VGKGVKNVMKLSMAEIQKIRHLEDEYGLNVASIASPIGKVKLLDKADGTTNAYVPFKQYLAKDVAKACELAHAFETKLIRGFSFYPPKGAKPEDHLEQAVDQIGRIAEACHRSDLTFGLEVEANLVGRTGQLLAEIHRRVNHPALVLVFDAANLIVQGFTTAEVWKQWEAMKPGLGWVHIKDYRPVKAAARGKHVEEDALARCPRSPRSSRGGAFRACSSISSPTCGAAASSAARAAPTAWGSRCGPCAACSTRRRWPTISATSTISSPPADCEVPAAF